MTRNEKRFLKGLEKAQRMVKADLKRLEAFNSTHPGNLRSDKLKKLRYQRIYSSLVLREVIHSFHKTIVDPREDRYVHVSVVKRLRDRIAQLEKDLKAHRELTSV